MNDRISSEQLSAYFDDELDRSAQAEVEKDLAASADLQRELDEIRTLSNLLQELPVPKPPEEFCSSVMQAAERVTLLPVGESTVTSSGVRRLRWITATIATVAAMIMIALLVNSSQNPRLIATAQRDSSRHVLAESEEAVGDQPSGEAILTTERVAEPVDVLNLQELSAAKGADRQILFDNGLLSRAQVGDVVEGFDTSGKKIAVVKLYVVDRRKGLESLQLLLTQNQIPIEPDAQNELEPVVPAKQPTNQMMAVYVQTSKQQLTAALQQLDSTEGFHGLQIDSPIQLASLETDIGISSRFGLRRESAKRKDLPGSKSAAAEKKQEGNTVSTRPTDKVVSRNATIAKTKNDAGTAPIGDLNPVGRSRQLSVRIPDSILKTHNNQSGARDNQLRSEQRPFGKDGSSLTRTSGEAADRDTHSVQVLFVLVSRKGTQATLPIPTESAAGAVKAKGSTEASKSPPDGAACRGSLLDKYRHTACTVHSLGYGQIAL